MRCFRHVLLGGGCRADPGYSGEVISLSWLGFPVVSCRHQWSECLLRPHMLQEVNHWAHTADRGHCHSSWERLKMAMINESLHVNPNLVFTTQVTLTHLLKGSQESEHSHHLACPWLWQESHYIQLLQLIAKHLWHLFHLVRSVVQIAKISSGLRSSTSLISLSKTRSQLCLII